MSRQRLQKLMAAAGLCSRRKAEEWLKEGRVTVNARVASLGDQADPDHETICVDGRPLRVQSQQRVLLLNKPVGVISSCRDPQRRRTVLDLIPVDQRAGLHPVGRLDVDSRGALLLTNVGELTLKLTHPRFDHSKVYRVRVQGCPGADVLMHWQRGVRLDGSLTRNAGVRLLRCGARDALLEVTLQEGRNRQIRRVAEALGHPVLDLQRIAIAGIVLGSLKEGCWRTLSEREWAGLLNGSASRLQPPGPCP